MNNNEIEELKKKLKQYNRKGIQFNEPHFTQQLILREGSKEMVISEILNPEKLVYFYKEEGKFSDIKYMLYFKISNSRTMILPTIFKKKSLYILTYIMRHRLWKNMVKKERRKKCKK